MKLVFLLGIIMITGPAFAQTSPRYHLVRSVKAGGGATFSTSASYRLGGTIGQAATGAPSSSRYSLQGGFWVWEGLQIFANSKVGEDFVISFETETGKNYVVEFTDSLSNPVWQVAPEIPGDGAVQTVAISAAGVPGRFFRLRQR